MTSRELNPWAWWTWALGIAAAASLITNPLAVALVYAVLCLVVAERRSNSPWAKAFGMYLWVAGFIVIFRISMYVVVGAKRGEVSLFHLPGVHMPEWAAGINLLGTVYAEGLTQAGLDGLRLGAIIVACGAANSVANPKQMVRSLPAALGEVGTAMVIALSLAPQLAESVVRVRQARELRGDDSTGLRNVPSLIVPVLQDALDGALKLASSMDARGYGRRAMVSARRRRVNATASFVGLSALCIGAYLLLGAEVSPLLNLGVLAGGCVLVLVALKLQGQRAITTRYRRQPWRHSEWITATSGILVLGAVLVTQAADPLSLRMPNFPLAVPGVPWLVLGALVVAVAPAFLTPRQPIAQRSTRILQEAQT